MWPDFGKKNSQFLEKLPVLQKAFEVILNRKWSSANPVDRYIFMAGHGVVDDFMVATSPPKEATLTRSLRERRGERPTDEFPQSAASLRDPADEPAVAEEPLGTNETPTAAATLEPRDLVEEVHRISQAPSTDEVFDIQGADFVLFEQVVALKVGQWQLLPPEAAKQSMPPFA